MSTHNLVKSYHQLSTNFVFSADFNQKKSKTEIQKMLIWTLLIALVMSGIRQALRLRIDESSPATNPFSNVDGVNVILTMILTVSFYPLLYKSYSFVYRGTEEKETEHVLYKIALLAQLAVIRDLLFIIFVSIKYGTGLFENQTLESRDFVFTALDAVLWFLTIIMMAPVVIPRLNKPKSQDDTLILAFLISCITFWLTWVFNFIVLRVFVELPFGGDLFS